MNFSLLGPSNIGTYTDEMLGGPPQKIQNAYYSLLAAIRIADMYSHVGNNVARAARLNAFKTPWLSKAEMIWFYGHTSTPTAVDYANGLAAEVNAALAVND